MYTVPVVWHFLCTSVSVTTEAPAMLSCVTSRGSVRRFPLCQALWVDLRAQRINIWVTPTPLSPSLLFLQVLWLQWGHTQTHKQRLKEKDTHIRGVDGHALAVKRNRADQLLSEERVCVCVIDVSSLFHLLQTAACMITLMLSERGREGWHLWEYQPTYLFVECCASENSRNTKASPAGHHMLAVSLSEALIRLSNKALLTRRSCQTLTSINRCETWPGTWLCSHAYQRQRANATLRPIWKTELYLALVLHLF